MKLELDKAAHGARATAFASSAGRKVDLALA
jgi:hypothetical protein